MDFEFSEEQEALRASVRRFVEERAPLGWVRDRYDDPRGTTDDVWSGLADLGVLGLLVPDAHGGAGGGMVDAALVLETLGRSVHPGPYASSAIGAVGLVLDAGAAADHAAMLPGLADGSSVGTVALLEPSRRAEWRNPTTTARADGDAWRLDGTKIHVPDLMAATTVLTTATDLAGVVGAFVVDVAAPGTTTRPTPTVDGSRKEGTLTLEGVSAHRLGGDAAPAIAATVDRLAIAAVVEGVGTAERALELSTEYAKERRQFDAPIGSFQAVQHLCADMLRAVELARAAGYYACWAADEADPAERHRAATMALAFAGDELYGVGASAVQIHAGIGFTWEHDLHLFYKRLLTLQQTGGGSVDQLEELASIALA
ncbi:MAG TPA: acyl-CoA dehydrogenase family protein [Acidimicrobiia bacterium]|nr:acyl-CoA dehydrogenase family protein [Acidimicrobiia bacterium]